MKCSNCGENISDGQRFCSHCGAEQPQQDAPQGETPITPSASQSNTDYAAGAASDGNKIVLTIFATICAVVYGFYAFRGVLGVLGSLPWIFRGEIFYAFTTLLFNALFAVTGIWLCLSLLLMAFRRTSEISDGLLLCICGGGIVRVVVRVLNVVVMKIFYYYGRGAGKAIFLCILGVLVTVGGIYLILRFLLGENPILGKTTQDLQNDLKLTFAAVSKIVSQISSSIGKGQSGQPQNQPAQGQPVQPQNPSAQGQPIPVPPVQNNQTALNAVQTPGSQYGAYGPAGAGVTPMFRLKTDRSLLLYIILSFVTCGIYSLYFIYALARDLNIVCEGDGRTTGGLVKLILLSAVTCGIYGWIWWYGVGNRLAVNAPRYGMTFPENGTTVLMWMLFGSLLCGIGPFIAMHIIIKNMNMLCGAYNHAHNM